jgi:hypothetical protein
MVKKIAGTHITDNTLSEEGGPADYQLIPIKGDSSIDLRIDRSTQLFQLSHSFYSVVC